jgi:hypothetical protein
MTNHFWTLSLSTTYQAKIPFFFGTAAHDFCAITAAPYRDVALPEIRPKFLGTRRSLHEYDEIGFGDQHPMDDLELCALGFAD